MSVSNVIHWAVTTFPVVLGYKYFSQLYVCNCQLFYVARLSFRISYVYKLISELVIKNLNILIHRK